MRRRAREGLIIGVALVAMLAGSSSALANCDDPFRNPDDILDFHLQMPAATWTAFQNSVSSATTCDGQFPYFSAQFRCGDNEPYVEIGFRRKRDRSETKAKLPIKVDFNHEVAGQRWPAARGDLGFRKLSLNSGQADDAGRVGGGRPANPGTLSALLTEHLAWRVMRQELAEASGVAYARVTLHFSDTGTTQLQGLYVLIEDIDRTAVRARFIDDEGLLVKTTDLGCVDEVEFDDGAPNPATDLFTAWLAESPTNFSGAWAARTEQAMHLDPLLRQEALRELLANTGDTVLGNRNNYYALDLRNDRRWYLPWDLDDMFRPFPQVRAPDTALVHACTGGAGCSPNAVGLNIRDNPEIRQRYLEIMCQLSNGVATETRLTQQLLAVDALIRPIIAEEIPSIWAPLGRDPLDASVEGTYAAEVERMKSWIPARIQAVRRLIEAEGVSCPADCAAGATTACEYLGTLSRRVCSAGVWGACENPTPRPVTGTGGAGAGGTGAGGTGAAGRTGAAGAAGASGGTGSAGPSDDAGPPVDGSTAGAGVNSRHGCSCAWSGPGPSTGWPAVGRSGGAVVAVLLMVGMAAFRRRAAADRSRHSPRQAGSLAFSPDADPQIPAS